jgi:hypothetical protein
VDTGKQNIHKVVIPTNGFHHNMIVVIGLVGHGNKQHLDGYLVATLRLNLNFNQNVANADKVGDIFTVLGVGIADVICLKCINVVETVY